MLTLPLSEVASASPGKLITLASADMALIESSSRDLHYLIAAPLGAVLSIISLYNIVSGLSFRWAMLHSTVFS